MSDATLSANVDARSCALRSPSRSDKVLKRLQALTGVSPHNNFDIMRLAAATLVLYAHGHALWGTHEPGFLNHVSVGPLAVYIFFAISGYLVSQSFWQDRHMGRYLVKRSLRIFPALIVMTLCAALMLGALVSRLPPAEYYTHSGTWAYLRNILLSPVYALPGVFEQLPVPDAVNGSLWSLPIEFLMYLLVPLVFASRRYDRQVLIGMTSALALLNWLWLPTVAEPIVVYGSDLRKLVSSAMFFLGGSCIYRFGLDRQMNPGVIMLIVVCLAIGFGNLAVFTTVMWVAVPYCVLAYCRQRSRLAGLIAASGDYSYGIYIYAFPVQQTLKYAFPDLGLLTYMITSFAVTLVCAVASWRWIERPALQWKNRLTYRPKAEAAGASHVPVGGAQQNAL